MDSNLNNSLETLFAKMESFVSTKTVVGEPINIGDVIMLPLVDVTFGVGAGAGASNKGYSPKDAGGAEAGGLGAKITPSAVIVIKNDAVQLVNIKNQDAVSKLIDMAPGIINKLNFGTLFNSKKEKAEDSDENRIISEEIIKE